MITQEEDICIHRDSFLINITKKDVKFNNPTVFLTYPGPGIIGPIIANEMVSSLKLEKIGFFKSNYLTPVTVFLDNQLRHPYVIYTNKDGTIVLISIDYPVPEDSHLVVSEGLIRWVNNTLNAKYIVCLDGIPVNAKPDSPIIITAAEKEVAEDLRKYAVKPYENGVVVGLSGALMSEALIRDIVGITLLTPAIVQFPDPEAAVNLINVINDYFKLKIDTEHLLAEAKKIKEQLSLINQKQQAIQDQSYKSNQAWRESFT